MKLKLHHPLWVHIPAFIQLAFTIGIIISARNLLGRQVPIHFGPTGIPDNFCSTWEAVSTMLISTLMFIGAALIIDDDWARHELRKAFNWLSLVDELAVGIIAAIALGYFDMFSQRFDYFTFPWLYVALFAGGGVLLAAILEWVRPWKLWEDATTDAISLIVDDVRERIARGERWTYAESQNPGWIKALILIVGALCLAIAIDSWVTAPDLTYTLLVVSVVVFMLWGGFIVTVDSERVVVRAGTLGIPILRIKTQDIADAAVHAFSPLRDFGGWGIRFNDDMAGYFLRGNRGVRLRTTEGKQFLIGSDTPAQLVAVIEIATEQRQTVEGKSAASE